MMPTLAPRLADPPDYLAAVMVGYGYPETVMVWIQRQVQLRRGARA